MKESLKKYCGIFPAFYACYDEGGAVSPERARALTRRLIGKGITGLYVGGSSGECIYQTAAERKTMLEAVMEEARGKVTVIAHVACNGIAESRELAAHAEALGVDAIAAIPPIYFHLPEGAIAQYWNAISDAAPHTDFIIYNIPQLAGVSLTLPLLREMRENPRLIGVKNSSMPVQDIQMWRDEGGEDFVVFNGPDEQLVSGLAAGACGGIGGTYAVMPELYLRAFRLFREGKTEEARRTQNTICRIIYEMCSAQGNLYAVLKALLALDGCRVGTARPPMPGLAPSDDAIVRSCARQIAQAIG